MKAPLHLILQVLACVLFFLAGVMGPWPFAPDPNNTRAPWGGRLLAWGLFCWCLSTMVTD